MIDLCEVVITAPDPEWLENLTRELVTEGLCASAHNFAPVRSVYRWQGKFTSGPKAGHRFTREQNS